MRRTSLVAITLAVAAAHGGVIGFARSMAMPALVRHVPSSSSAITVVQVPRTVTGRLAAPLPPLARTIQATAPARESGPGKEDPSGQFPGAVAVTPSTLPRTAAAPTHAPASSSPRRQRPVYPTRTPPTVTLAYRLHQSNPDGRSLDGPAALAWQVDAGGYRLQLVLQPADAPARSWTSAGLLGPGGVEPRSLVQQDGPRQTRRLELKPPDGEAAAAPRVRGRGRAGPPAALTPGSQDRWSWLAQLVAILEAYPRAPPAFIDLTVTGLRGTVEQWRFARQDAIPIPVPSGTTRAPAPPRAARLLMMVREPERPYDLRIEAWLDPARHHWPAALRLSTPPSRWTFYLQGID